MIDAAVSEACTVFVAPGVYSSSTTGENFPLKITNQISLIGHSREEVILDAEKNGRVLIVENTRDNVIDNVTIKNGSMSDGGGVYCEGGISLFKNIVIESNEGHDGGGMHLKHAYCEFKNVVIRNNDAYRGGAIFCIDASANLERVTINSNNSDHASGIYFERATAQLLNVTLCNNTSNQGSGIYCRNAESLVVKNSIFWDNTSNNIYLYLNRKFDIAYSNILGGRESIKIFDDEKLIWGEGNINADPFFVDVSNNNYNIRYNSPCIDAGDPDHKKDPDNTRVDIGAYYYDQSTSLSLGNVSKLPYEYAIGQNYPNPFNSSTSITYNLHETCNVMLKVHNTVGQVIDTLVDNVQTTGVYKITWRPNNLPSGIYLFKFQTDNFSKIIKIIYQK